MAESIKIRCLRCNKKYSGDSSRLLRLNCCPKCSNAGDESNSAGWYEVMSGQASYVQDSQLTNIQDSPLTTVQDSQFTTLDSSIKRHCTLAEGIIISQKYRVLNLVGMGGHGEVYRATDMHNDTTVALKRVRPELYSQQLQSRLLLEADNIMKLHHPNIVSFIDLVYHHESPIVVTEFISGTTLKTRLDKYSAESRLPSDGEVRTIINAVCRGLSLAHLSGIVHRDIKPSNIMILRKSAASEKADRIKILDFGLALSDKPDDISMTGLGLGTMDYCSPEQKTNAKAVDHRADIFSVGALLYQMLSGLKPPAHPSKLDDNWRDIVMKACEPDPADRYQDVNELMLAIKGTMPIAVLELEPNSDSDCIQDESLPTIQNKKEVIKFVSGAEAHQPSKIEGRVLALSTGIVSLSFVAISLFTLILTGQFTPSLAISSLGIIPSTFGVVFSLKTLRKYGGIRNIPHDSSFKIGIYLLYSSVVISAISLLVIIGIGVVYEFTHSNGVVSMFGFLFLIAIGMGIIALYDTRCPACLEFYAKEDDGQYVIGQFYKSEVTIDRTHHYRNGKNHVTGLSEPKKVGHSDTYGSQSVLYNSVRHKHRCKFCCHQWETEHEEKA